MPVKTKRVTKRIRSKRTSNNKLRSKATTKAAKKFGTKNKARKAPRRLPNPAVQSQEPSVTVFEVVETEVYTEPKFVIAEEFGT